MHHDQDTWDEYDARGIYLTKVCDVCVAVKLKMFNNDVLTNPQYETDEPIEDES
jgi:hypothetical protein|tara:strand:- start:5 stop:166 length:162 start_codon:yes stop_codon:yes gene_type:complete